MFLLLTCRRSFLPPPDFDHPLKSHSDDIKYAFMHLNIYLLRTPQLDIGWDGALSETGILRSSSPCLVWSECCISSLAAGPPPPTPTFMHNDYPRTHKLNLFPRHFSAVFACCQHHDSHLRWGPRQPSLIKGDVAKEQRRHTKKPRPQVVGIPRPPAAPPPWGVMSSAGPKVITLLALFRLCIMHGWTFTSRVQRFTRGGGGTVGWEGATLQVYLIVQLIYVPLQEHTHINWSRYCIYMHKSQKKKHSLNI